MSHLKYKRIYLWALLIFVTAVTFGQKSPHLEIGRMEREYFVKTLIKIADPILESLSKNEFKLKMPLTEVLGDRKEYTYLEGFGRLLSGMAPWLELGPDNSKEGIIRKKYILLARRCLHNATDPKSPDFMNFNMGKQPVVDAAFLAQALLRAPKQLWDPLDDETKVNVLNALKSSRVITPYNSNWLLFSAMVESAILKFEGKCEMAPITRAINAHMKWYLGDGVYGDGPEFHWDYYNSYVIQPMFVEVLQTLLDNKTDSSLRYQEIYKTVLKRAVRYANIQESLISPEGTFPAIGRSLAYRFGAFQLLTKIALMHALDPSIQPAQVRAALYTVVKRQIEMPGTFDKEGWLQIGFAGHQKSIAEGYISTGSLYLCSEAFLILGLPSDDGFWSGQDLDWTSKKIWKGIDISVEHAID